VRSFLLLSPFSFDSSLAGIFWTLSQGGTLVLPRPGGERDPVELCALIAQSQVSHVLSLPSLYALLLEQSKPEQLRSLETIIVAGEPCPRGVVAQHHKQIPAAALFNEYGVTEGTVWSSVHQCRKPAVKEPIPVGRPIANTQIYILDDRLRPVPIGIPGELHIGGVGLARGYLNRPELTAEKFIPNPFADTAGTRLYKTGDGARFLSDGNVEYLGRLDAQVKIRGFRVEPGEIESVLGLHPAVKENVVVAREDQADDKRLVAYIVPRHKQAPLPAEWRGLLKAKLPDYMVPSAFVMLETLPRTSSGKLDRHALPAPKRSRAELGKTFAAPRNAVEEAVARIWAEILGVDRVGVDDNFFELGGHSLLATQVVSRLRSIFQLELPLRCMFDSPTLSGLAEAIIANESQPGKSERIARLLGRIAGMSPEETRVALQEKRAHDSQS
jgi:acyl-coenzyme A synthetase/AMP-(fatty) acid ligase/acyl carrier protein